MSSQYTPPGAGPLAQLPVRWRVFANQTVLYTQSVAEQLLPFVLDQMHRRSHTFIFTNFWPKLEAAGVARATFDAILTDNPRRLFGG